MPKTTYSFLTFSENTFAFYESGREPRSLAQIKKNSIFGFAANADPNFNQVLVRVINEVAAEGWEMAMVGPGLVWYFRRPGKGK